MLVSVSASAPPLTQAPALYDGSSPESTSSHDSAYMEEMMLEVADQDVQVDEATTGSAGFYNLLESPTLSLEKWQSTGPLQAERNYVAPSTPVNQMIPEIPTTTEMDGTSPYSDFYESPEPTIVAQPPIDNGTLPQEYLSPYMTIEGTDIPLTISTRATFQVSVSPNMRKAPAKCCVRFETGSNLFNTTSQELMNARVTGRNEIRLQSHMSAMIEGSLWFDAIPVLTGSHFRLERVNFEGEIETLLDLSLEHDQLLAAELSGEYNDVLKITYATFDGMRTLHMTTGNSQLLHDWLTALNNPYVVFQAPMPGQLLPSAKLETLERKPVDVILCLPHYNASGISAGDFTSFIDSVLARMGTFDTLGLVIYGVGKSIKTLRSRGPLATDWVDHSWMKLLDGEAGRATVEHIKASLNAAATMVGARNVDRASSNKTVFFVSSAQTSGVSSIPAYLAGREAKLHCINLGNKRPFTALKKMCLTTDGTYEKAVTAAEVNARLTRLTIRERSYVHRRARMVLRPAPSTQMLAINGATSYFVLDNAGPNSPASVWVNMGTIYEDCSRDLTMEMQATVARGHEGPLNIVDFHIDTDSRPSDTIKNSTSIVAEVLDRPRGRVAAAPMLPYLYSVPMADYLPSLEMAPPLYQGRGVVPEPWLDGVQSYPNGAIPGGPCIQGGAWWTDSMLANA